MFGWIKKHPHLFYLLLLVVVVAGFTYYAFYQNNQYNRLVDQLKGDVYINANFVFDSQDPVYPNIAIAEDMRVDGELVQKHWLARDAKRHYVEEGRYSYNESKGCYELHRADGTLYADAYFDNVLKDFGGSPVVYTRVELLPAEASARPVWGISDQNYDTCLYYRQGFSTDPNDDSITVEVLH